MHGDCYAFFGLTRHTVVRDGAEAPAGDFVTAHTEMLLQVCRDYAGLPDARTLTAAEIRFFYRGLRAELKEHTRPQ